MNSDLSARLGALLLSVLLLCGLSSGCSAQPTASSGEAYPVSPPAAALSETPSKVTEPPGLPSSETPPDAASSPATGAAEPEPPGFPSSETPPDAASSPATGAAEPEPPPAEPSPSGQPARPTTLTVRTPAAPARPTTLTVRTPAAPGKDKSEGGGAVIDYSNRSEGYVMVKYSGGASRVKIQITGPDKTTYTYDSSKNGFEAFPLTAGNGGYTVNVYTEIHSSQYALAQGASFQATLTSGLLPYLYPSQYVSYTAGSKAVAKGEELASSAATVLEVVGSVYTTETGWINGIIQFDGKSWKLLDPTFASNGNQSSSIMQFIGNGSNYQRKYCY